MASAVATPVAKRSSLGEDQIKAAIGAVFLLLSVMYVFSAVKEIVEER